ncbi:hypothetical protein IHE45_17G040500 [Dioscorea alata]|uniref:Uncharacterized protein n=1 Tax=Dioscorea alata TaxID=55571 RepID=A0ACB7UBM8_DIOAL|nr:hypothetical protein IHE45_17G040500 [Dioscorea alata]
MSCFLTTTRIPFYVRPYYKFIYIYIYKGNPKPFLKTNSFFFSLFQYCLKFCKMILHARRRRTTTSLVLLIIIFLFFSQEAQGRKLLVREKLEIVSSDDSTSPEKKPVITVGRRPVPYDHHDMGKPMRILGSVPSPGVGH